jgi:hypothetical protein
MGNSKTHKIAEDICKLGCNRVNEIIECIERKQDIAEIAGLAADEIDLLLSELKDIMAVYRKRS